MWFLFFFFFFKQKTAYEMRISDWSSDVCSSDLLENFPALVHALFDLLVENFAAHEKADVDGTACRAVERWPHRPEFDVFRRTDHHRIGIQHQIDRKSTRLNSSH